MSHRQRLISLLSTFRLPGEASSTELREAYLREAKRLHPDCNPEAGHSLASRQFAELQARFNEASTLLQKRDAWQSMPGPSRQTSWKPMQHTTWDASAVYAEQQAIPVVGLPPGAVYAFAALASGAIAATTLSWPGQSDKAPAQKNSLSPTVRERHVPVISPQVTTADANRDATAYSNAISKLRRTSSRSELRRTSSRSEKPGRIDFQLRDGLDLTPVQVAAEDGNVWFLDRCGASRACSSMLNFGDRRGDTALHKCALKGHTLACRTLLRIGADPSVENKWHLRPQDLAAHNDNFELVELFRAARYGDLSIKRHGDLQPAYSSLRRHPDGLGLIVGGPPKGISYFGPYHSATLRNAVNNAAGQDVIADVVLSGESQAELDAASQSGRDIGSEFALNRTRRALQGSGFELETGRICPEEFDSATGARGWSKDRNGAEVLGLLMFEPAGVVTTDAPGHWFAVRGLPLGRPDGAEAAPDAFRIFRLDPVRGVFAVDDAEFAELLKRYPAWRMVKKPVKFWQRN